MPSWSAIQSIHDRACDVWRMTNWKIITYDSLQASITRQILTCRSAWSSRGSGTWMVHSHSYHTSRSFSGQPSSPSHVLPIRSEHAQNACSRAAVLAGKMSVSSSSSSDVFFARRRKSKSRTHFSIGEDSFQHEEDLLRYYYLTASVHILLFFDIIFAGQLNVLWFTPVAVNFASSPLTLLSLAGLMLPFFWWYLSTQ